MKVKNYTCYLLIFLTFILLVTSCASVPRRTSFVSHKVTEGIKRIQVENEKIIKAFADTERAILDEKWDNIYLKTEKMYVGKHKIADMSQFTQDDRRKIAANAASVRETIQKEIEKCEKELIDQSRANTNTVIMMNDEVIQYLDSLENVKDAQNHINDMFKNLTGIDVSNLQGMVANKIKELEDKN